MPKALIVRDRWPIGRLKINPLQKELYPDRKATVTNEFIERVKKYGVQTDIKVAPSGKILGGHRRYYAAKAIGLTEVPVVVRHDVATDPIGQDELFYLDNDIEPETTEQKARRFQGLLKCEEARAEARKKRGLKRGASPVSPNSDAREKPDEKGRSDEKAAKAVGMGRDAARKASEVVDAIDEAEENGDQETAEDLRETLNKSVDGAHKKTKKPEEKIHDGNGNLVPKKLRDHHEKVSEFRSICSFLDRAATKLENIEGKGTEYLDRQEMAAAVRKVREAIMDQSYWSHCPSCAQRGCKRCKSTGYLPRQMRSALNTSEKKALGLS